MDTETKIKQGLPDRGRLLPQRYLLWRRLFLLAAVLLIMVAATIIYQFNWALNFIAPGELSRPHSQLWQGVARQETCQSCHPSSTGTFLNLTPLAQQASPHPGMRQQEACAACHASQLENLLRGTPHDLTLLELETLGKTSKAKLVSSQIHIDPLPVKAANNSPIDWHSRSFACSDCHHEHQGLGFSLSAMSDQRCQACHHQRFESFAHDHTEFKHYPKMDIENKIAFDHRSHSGKHFVKDNKAFDCNVCHLQDRNGTKTLVRSTGFDAACAACHREPLSVSLSEGIVLWQLPNVDINAIGDSLDGLQNWPEAASYVNDLPISPLMRQLVIAEMKVGPSEVSVQAIERLTRITNLDQLDVTKLIDRQLIIEVAKAAKNILLKLATDGQAVVKERLSDSALPHADSQLVSPYQVRLASELCIGIPPEIFDATYRRWFEKPDRTVEADSIGARDGARIDRITPPTKLPSPFAPPEQNRSQNQPANSTDNLITDADLFLSDNALLTKADSRNAQAFDGETIALADSSTFVPQRHLQHGGWMVDPLRMAIVYIPSGHGDRWMQAYGEWIAEQTRAGNLARSDSNSGVISKCVECHRSTIDRVSFPTDNQPLWAAWQTNPVDPLERKLTRFDHRPHLALPLIADCTSCHRLNAISPSASTLVSVASESESTTSVGHSIHDFQYLRKSDCNACHNAQTQVQSCTQCHNYHVNH